MIEDSFMSIFGVKKRNRKQTGLFLFFLLLVFWLSVSGFGIINSGRVSITVIQIPIIIATIVLGLPEGLLLSLVFGAATMLRAAGYPDGSLDALFTDPRLSILPRLMIPLVVHAVWRGSRRIAEDNTVSSCMICSGFTAIFGVLANVVFVVLAMAKLYPYQLGVTDSFSTSTAIITNVIAANVMFEILSSLVLSCTFVPFLKAWLGDLNDKKDGPIRKTFQKWLLVFITLAFFIILIFFYNMQTMQERGNAEKLLLEKSRDIELLLLQEKTGSKRLPEKALSEEAADGYLKIGEQGYAMIIRDNVVLLSGKSFLTGEKLSTLLPAGKQSAETSSGTVYTSILGVPGIMMKRQLGNELIVLFLPDKEIYAERNQLSLLLLGGLLCLFILMYVNISGLVEKNVVTKIHDVNASLVQIQKGNLEEKVAVTSNTEFIELSKGINATVQALNDITKEAAARLNRELEFAQEIQQSALPVEEQAKAPLGEYEISGRMKAAKEVGGDFYDFFPAGENLLGFVIADVSGKGIPAALFMMTAKTLIKNFLMGGKSPAKALELANRQLCENNEAGMFVTVWLGLLDYKSGELRFANAGHNPPLYLKKDGTAVFLRQKQFKRSIMLGFREDVRFEDNCLQLAGGDTLFLYTDGVTEANNAEGSFYGEKRLQDCAEQYRKEAPAELMSSVFSDISHFASGTEQFDDITMLVLKMHADWASRTVEAVFENTEPLLSFMLEVIPQDCSKKVRNQLAIAFDEIYSNIVKYSHAKTLTFKVGIVESMIYLSFADDGIPYDPLGSRTSPEASPDKKNQVGGFGLLIVRRQMDYVHYQYQNAQNLFTAGKRYTPVNQQQTAAADGREHD